MISKALISGSPKPKIKPMIINRIFSKRRFLLLQGIHILLFFTFLGPVSPLALFMSGVVCILFYGLLIRAEIIRLHVVVSPLIFYLAAATMRLGFATCWASAVYHQGYIGTLHAGIYDPTPYLMYGHAILLVGDWFFITGYTLWARIKGGSVDLGNINIPDSQKLVGLGIGLIAFGWLVRTAFILGIPLGNIGQLGALMCGYSSPAGFLLLLYALHVSSRSRRKIISVLILAFFISEMTFSLGSYMKQAVIIVLIPFLMYFLASSRRFFRNGMVKLSKKRLFMAIGIVFFVAIILFPFSEMRRPHYWLEEKKPRVLPYLIEVAKGAIPFTDRFNMLYTFPDGKFWYFFSRQASIVSCSWSYGHVLNSGDLNGELIKDGLFRIIPRIFWPEKPSVGPGAKIAVLLGQAKSVETAGTSSGAGDLAGSLYLNWGTPCLILGTFLNGIMLCLTWSTFRPYLFTNPVASIVGMILIVAAGRHFESGTAGFIPFYAYIFVVFFPLLLLTHALFTKGKKRGGKVSRL